MPRIYLDNAATSWPKPDSVYTATDAFARECGAASGRGAYSSATEAGKVVAAARAGVARMIGVSDPSRIVFTANGTAALNLAIHGLLRAGDHVVTTVCEHNSVLRPLHAAAQQLGCVVDFAPCDAEGHVTTADILALVTPTTRLVVMTHASNVTGAILPIAEVAAALRSSPTLLLLDAAQTVGRLPLDAESHGIDLIAAPGHKGLLGPTGTGFLYIETGLEAKLTPIWQGGVGSASDDLEMPTTMPERYEAGSLAVTPLAGLAKGIAYIEHGGRKVLCEHVCTLTAQLAAGLAALPKLKLLGPAPHAPRAGVVSFTLEGYDAHDVAAILDASFGIEARSGLHCAARIHAALGAPAGSVRMSPGCFTTEAEIESAIAAVANL
jgi:cysteine desulfurase / selenocysteine lyase